MSGETLIIGDFYIEKEYAEMIYNEIKEKMLTEQRRQARKIARERRLYEQERKAERKYFARQKFYGLIITLISLIITLINGNLICLTFAVFGIYAMVTKNRMIFENRNKTN